ncbi:hypothetical protein MKW94_017537 [Papaver nudicaule]|uniref:F-box associated beta-propeller type 3 domain-containing protein n=1 Tax=Papaver nudicaule TaxID=74823 RepID=A0AA41VT93_PAPNU|nr:hypothetical protein [Papaver nudicaule]
MFSKTTFVIDVWNFTTNEVLRIMPPVMVDKQDTSPTRGVGYTPFSCGFGFNSFNNQYKLVIIGIVPKTGCRQGFVYTSGTKSSWQEIELPGQKATSPQGTFTPYGGGGALFWKTSDTQTILQFDLHQDKFQYIRIPLEKNEYPASNDHTRLLESEGFLGVAILLWGSNAIKSTLEKVHLKIYKDNQVWVKETFDVSLCALPYSANFRFISFYDQVLLYWMNTETNCFHFFNLHSKCLKVVQKLTSHIKEKILVPLCPKHSSLRTLLPERAQKSDFASVRSMMTKGIEDVFRVQEPKPFGALASFCPSKINKHGMCYLILIINDKALFISGQIELLYSEIVKGALCLRQYLCGYDIHMVLCVSKILADGS